MHASNALEGSVSNEMALMPLQPVHFIRAIPLHNYADAKFFGSNHPKKLALMAPLMGTSNPLEPHN